ncbi:MAG TPA: MarR family transcriptional regulator [Acidimicrobiales bacterium]|nr:MarR family transcriptional regulator [Acidimicrobiales bacterium]
MRPAGAAPSVDGDEIDADEAWRLVYSLVLEGEAHTRLHEVCRDVGLPVNLFKAMLTLDRPQPAAMRDLADYFNFDASYCTALVDGLEAQGIAERRPHPTDRRIKTVVLTEKGRRVLARARSLMGEAPASFRSLSPTEQRRLRTLLTKVAAADPVLSAKRREATAQATG